MNIADNTLWIVSREGRSIRTPAGVLLLDSERDMYCDLALLAAAVWLLIKWTPAGITVREIVDLLETAAPLPRHILETETCKLLASLGRKGFIRKRSRESVIEHRNAHGQTIRGGINWL